MSRYTKEEKIAAISKYAWYHRIDLGDGVVTPGNEWEHLWNMIRAVRSKIAYEQRAVLDIGSWDGLWAFEAEKLGARYVVATDCAPAYPFENTGVDWQHALEKFLLLRDILGSKAIPFYNASPYNLTQRLDSLIFRKTGCEHLKFDIVQHLGVLYHLRNPLHALSEARNVLKDNGTLLVETACILDEPRSVMLFNGAGDPKTFRICADRSTWWAPSWPCLKEMLQTSFFEPLEDTVQFLPLKGQPQDNIGRVAVACRAVPVDKGDPALRAEMAHYFRNPDHIPFFG